MKKRTINNEIIDAVHEVALEAAIYSILIPVAERAAWKEVDRINRERV